MFFPFSYHLDHDKHVDASRMLSIWCSVTHWRTVFVSEVDGLSWNYLASDMMIPNQCVSRTSLNRDTQLALYPASDSKHCMVGAQSQTESTSKFTCRFNNVQVMSLGCWSIRPYRGPHIRFVQGFRPIFLSWAAFYPTAAKLGPLS